MNAEQNKAIKHTEGPLLIEAGPGTGKTRTLTEKITSLLQETASNASEILVLTFSTKAAAELGERVKREGNMPWIATFHGLAYTLYSWHYGERPSILEPEERRKLVKDLAKEYDLSVSDLSLSLTKSRSSVSSQPRFPQALEAYRTRLHEDYGAIDFDELLLEAYRLLQNESGIRAELQARAHMVCVDEFQDTNEIQNEMLALIAETANHICAIGDPHQAIYGFRGARPDAFDIFRTRFPHTSTITLPESYRSSPEILTAATDLFSEPPSLQSTQPHASQPRVVHCASERKEGQFIAREIRRLMGGLDLNEYTYEESKLRFSDIAVLYRSHEVGATLEPCLRKDSIPTFRAQETPFSEQTDITHVLKQIEQTPTNHATALSHIVQNAISHTIEEKNLTKQTPKAEERQSRLYTLASLTRRWDHLSFQEARDELYAYLRFLDEETQPPSGDRVQMMSIHGAKGLEFPVVFVAGLEEGLLPFCPPNDSPDLAEEQRLLYVAMTRAERELFLSLSYQRPIYGTNRSRRPSRFINSLPLHHVTHQRTGFTKKESSPDPQSQTSLF